MAKKISYNKRWLVVIFAIILIVGIAGIVYASYQNYLNISADDDDGYNDASSDYIGDPNSSDTGSGSAYIPADVVPDYSEVGLPFEDTTNGSTEPVVGEDDIANPAEVDAAAIEAHNAYVTQITNEIGTSGVDYNAMMKEVNLNTSLSDNAKKEIDAILNDLKIGSIDVNAAKTKLNQLLNTSGTSVTAPSFSPIPAASITSYGTTSWDTLGQRVTNFMGILAEVGFLVMLIVGGIYYITSAGEEAKTEVGRKTITNAIIGIVVAALAWGIVTFIIDFFNK